MYKTAFELRSRVHEKQALLQKHSLVCLLDKIMSLEKPIYTAYFKDFRGRFYANSNLHPMYTRALRSVAAPAATRSLEADHRTGSLIDCDKLMTSLSKSLYFHHLRKYFPEIQKLISSEIDVNREVDLYLCTVVLLELGKLNKTKLLHEGRVSLIEFCTEGFKL